MWQGNKVIIFVSFILVNITVYAGGDSPVIGSRQAGMGRSSVALTDFWNLQNNQAGIALMDKFGAGIYYETQFSLNKLSTKSAAFLRDISHRPDRQSPQAQQSAQTRLQPPVTVQIQAHAIAEDRFHT